MIDSVRGFCFFFKFDFCLFYFFFLRNLRIFRRIWRIYDGEFDLIFLDIFGGFINLVIMKKKFFDRLKYNLKMIFLVLIVLM